MKLKKAGYDVLAASNGMEALEVIGENKDIKLIVLDVMMPVMNGIQTMKLLLNRIEKTKEEKGDKKKILTTKMPRRKMLWIPMRLSSS